MKKTSLILLSLLVLPLFAGAFNGPFYDGGAKGLDRWMVILNNPELNLSQEQKDKIFDIILNAKKSINSISTEIMKVQYEKQKEISSNNPNWSKVKSLNEQIAKLRANILKIRLDTQVDILSNLTQEQRKKLRELRELKMKTHSMKSHPMRSMNNPHYKNDN